MTQILFVEDNHEYADMVCLAIKAVGAQPFGVTHVESLADALQSLRKETFDLVLLDLSLPDSTGLDTFCAVYTEVPDLPVVVITALDDREVALTAVREGAQDFLVKGEMEIGLLIRSLNYAIERHRTLTHMKHLSLVDDLTGLLNRRGFVTLAQQHLKIAQRSNRELLLLFADLDGLKQINDRFGHQEGDRALKQVSVVLNDTFRSSDLIARLGGDEYTVLAVDAVKDSLETMLDRLQDNLVRYNRDNPRYHLSVSVGTARFDPHKPAGLDELLAAADQDLYQVKRKKKTSS